MNDSANEHDPPVGGQYPMSEDVYARYREGEEAMSLGQEAAGALEAGTESAIVSSASDGEKATMDVTDVPNTVWDKDKAETIGHAVNNDPREKPFLDGQLAHSQSVREEYDPQNVAKRVAKHEANIALDEKSLSALSRHKRKGLDGDIYRSSIARTQTKLENEQNPQVGEAAIAKHETQLKEFLERAESPYEAFYDQVREKNPLAFENVTTDEFMAAAREYARADESLIYNMQRSADVTSESESLAMALDRGGRLTEEDEDDFALKLRRALGELQVGNNKRIEMEKRAAVYKNDRFRLGDEQALTERITVLAEIKELFEARAEGIAQQKAALLARYQGPQDAEPMEAATVPTEQGADTPEEPVEVKFRTFVDDDDVDDDVLKNLEMSGK